MALNVAKEWHIRLGHINKKIVMKILTDSSNKKIPLISPEIIKTIDFQCKVCIETNLKRMSYKRLIGTKESGTFYMDTWVLRKFLDYMVPKVV